MYKKFAFYLAAALILSASGCSLDEVKETGDFCPDKKSNSGVLSYIFTKAENKYDVNSSPEYKYYFENNVCPPSFSQCDLDSDGEYYCHTPCTKSAIACDGVCIPKDSMKSDPNHCGDCNRVCGIKQKCVDGNCIENQCNDNQCVKDGKCLNEDTACGPYCKDCNSDGNAAMGSCSDGTCQINKCQQGFHLKTVDSKTVCAINTDQECGESDSFNVENCTNDTFIAKCETGRCIIQICIGNAHIAGDGKSCVPNTPTSCASPSSNTPIDCNSLNPNGIWTCDDGNCKLTGCKNDFHEYNNTCEPNDDNNCGKHGIACDSAHRCDESQCVIKECDKAHEGELCSAVQVCKMMNEVPMCAYFDARDTQCFYDTHDINCKDPIRIGASGTCIYAPNLAKGYAKGGTWTCECSNPAEVFCVDTSAPDNSRPYRCVKNPSVCASKK